MATLNSSYLSLSDVMTRTNPDGSMAKVVEQLQIQAPFIRDLGWIEANQATGHIITSRTALPAISFRRFNEGITATKSRTDQVTETIGMLNSRSDVDVELAKLNGNESAYRMSEDAAHVMGMGKKAEESFFYASTKSAPEQIMGMAPRLDTLGKMCITSGIAASGSDQSSVWLVVHGPNTVYGIYPKGSAGGLERVDMGQQYVTDSGGTNRFRAWSTDFTWKLGLCVADSRYLFRVANVDTSAIAATGHLLIDAMVAATERVQDLDAGKPVFYCNRLVREYLRNQALDSVRNSTLSFDNVGGKPVVMFSGIPIHRTDAINNTEAIVS